jgi:thiamine-phosphate diphosphorylase
MTKSAVPQFVVILDRAGARYDVADVAVAAIRGGADVIQIREKTLPEAEVSSIAARVIEMVGDRLRVAVNGFPSIACELGTHLHLPEVMTLDRDNVSLAPGALLSRSIHDPAPVVAADYLILGNLLETGSKPGKAGLGFERFEELARASSAPVLAIGGIEPGQVKNVLRHGGYGVAVRSYVIGANHPERAAREIRRELDF